MKKNLKFVQLLCILLLACTLLLTACDNGTQQPPVSSEPESSENASTNDNNNINNNNNSNNDNQISDEKKEKYDQACALISQGKNEDAYSLLKSINNYAPAQEKLKNFFWAPTTVAEKWKYSDDVDFRTNIESYEYDSKGNLLGEKFSYDSNGNVLTGYDLIYKMEYCTYDYKNGKLYQQKTRNYVTTYFYNSRGLISRTVTEYNDSNYSSEEVYEYTYYPNGSVKTLVLDDYYEYHYDENGLITKLLCYSDYQTKELEYSIIVSYGEYGITKIDVQGIEWDESAIYTYSYDSVGKLEKLEVTSYYEDELDSTHLISYDYYQLCYSENLSVRERLSIICYTNLDAALGIIW